MTTPPIIDPAAWDLIYKARVDMLRAIANRIDANGTEETYYILLELTDDETSEALYAAYKALNDILDGVRKG